MRQDNKVGRLSKEELQVPRSAAEFLPFVKEAIERFSSHPEGTRQIRFRQGIAKPLIEEALPVGLLCERYFKADPLVTIQLVFGSQNYDAVITDARPRRAPFRYLEITQAHEGENEHLRMLALERDGHVNTLGNVRKKGTKRSGITVEVENEAKWHSEVLSSELKRVKEAIDRKAGKSYPDHTGLLIVLDDYVAIQDEKGIATLQSVLQESAEKLNGFCWIGAIGWSGKTFVEQEL